MGSGLEHPVECPTTATLYAGLQVRTILKSPGLPTSAYGEWRIVAPPGTRITRLRGVRWLGMEGGSGWRPYGRTAEETLLTGETCTVPAGQDECNVGPGAVDVPVDTSGLAYGIECVSVNGCLSGYSIHAARAAIHSATVTITDEVPPALTTPTGALVTEGGFHRGTESASFTGSDVTGLRKLRVYVDGVERASASPGEPGWGACDYTRVTPCESPTAARSLPVDTTKLADGPHVVEVAAVDAASNESRSSPRTIVVDNTAPAPPQDLATGRGEGWSGAPTVTATWANPPGQVSEITTAHWDLCLDGTPSTCVTGQAPAAAGRLADLPIPGDGQWRLRVRLEDAAGNLLTQGGAATTIRHDGTAPGAPEGLAIAARDDHDAAFTATWREPDGPGAPVTAVEWTLCPRETGTPCAGGAGPSGAPLTGRLPGVGDYVLSVRLRDAAGNIGANSMAVLRLTAEAPDGSPPTMTPAPLRPASLRVASAVLSRRTRQLTLSGSIARGAAGRVRIAVAVRLPGGHVHKRSLTVPIRGGRFRAALRVPPRGARSRRATVTVRFAGSPGYRPAAVVRKRVALRA